MADPIFDDPRLAAVYDVLDPDRSDLDPYVAMVDEFGARRVLDVGCTGTFALMLAARGLDVTGIDPAAASIAVARAKPQAELVRFVACDTPELAGRLPHLHVDAAFMTANVAQVFITNESWEATLDALRVLVAPGGMLVFETRDVERRAWERWSGMTGEADVPGVGRVSDTYQVVEVEDVAGGDVLVTFDAPTTFHEQGITIESRSTLRFRTREALVADLDRAGFDVIDVRDAPDRPGAEWVFVARRR